MSTRSVGGVTIFRPSLQAESAERQAAEDHLRQGYSTGEYHDPKKVNEILQFQFGYFYDRLWREIPHSASRYQLEFLLGQYDRTSEIEDLNKGGELSLEDTEYWSQLGPTIRRSLKHLAELVTMLAPSETPRLHANDHALLRNLETVIICCEMLVELYTQSEQTHSVFPERTTYTIFPERQYYYYALDVEGEPNHRNFNSRVQKCTSIRNSLFDSEPPIADILFHEQHLNTAFKAEFGFPYREGILAIRNLIRNTAQPDPEAFDVPFVRRESVMQAWESLGWRSEAIDRLLRGFEVRKENMESEERVIYRPQQLHRAFRRGMFVMPHETGPHLIFSRRMAAECLVLLMAGLAFQCVPPEWRSAGMTTAAASLQAETGFWFEQQVDRNIRALGLIGAARCSNRLGIGEARIEIPQEIGEFDFLGYLPDERALIVIEAKHLHSGMEPKFYRDDISAFVTERSSFEQKVQRKIGWIAENWQRVSAALTSALPDRPNIDPLRLSSAIVTYAPSFASYFVSSVPCVSLSELVSDFNEKGHWPYNHGSRSLE